MGSTCLYLVRHGAQPGLTIIKVSPPGPSALLAFNDTGHLTQA